MKQSTFLTAVLPVQEEQNSRNKFVLDGYASLYERQDRVELRFDAHEKSIEDLIKRRE